MGNEVAQEREWSHDHSLDWHLAERPSHAGIMRLVRDLNQLYRALPSLHQLDCEAAGFEWLVADDTDRSVFVWLRKARDPGDMCLVAVNFTPEVRREYRIRVPRPGRWREALNSDAAIYGGGNVGNAGAVDTVGDPESPELVLVLPPLAALFLLPEG